MMQLDKARNKLFQVILHILNSLLYRVAIAPELIAESAMPVT